MHSLISISSLLASIILFLLGIFVLSNGTGKTLNRSFFLYFLSLSVWGFGVYGLVTGYSASILIWLKIMETGVVFMPSTFLYFTYNLLTDEHRPRKTLVKTSIVLSAIYLGLSYTPYFFMGVTKVQFGYVGQPFPSPIFLVFVLFVITSMLYGLFCLYHELRHSRGSRLNQLFYFFFASALFWISALSVVPTLIGLVMFGGFPVWNFTNILYGVILSYAIIRHKLMDIEIVIKKGVVYSALTAILAVVYSAFVLMFQQIFQGRTGLNHWAVIIATSLTIAVGFKPLEDLFTKLTDRYFFKKAYDYRKALKAIGANIAEIMPLKQFMGQLIDNLTQAMRLSGACGAVWIDKTNSFDIIAGKGMACAMSEKQFAAGDKVVSSMEGKEYLIIEEADAILRSWMKENAIQVVLPFRKRGRINGLLLLGEKLSQDAYSDEDLELLTTLSPQLGTAIDNCMKYGEEKKMREAAEEKVEDARTKVERSNRLAALGTLTANLAHEIKNPMTVLRSRAERGLNKLDDKDFIKETYGLILTHIDRILKIVGNMLKFAKTKEEGLFPLDVNRVLDATLALAEGKIKEKNLEVIREYKAEKAVIGDLTSLQEAFLNIIMNGIHFMGENGRLTISTLDRDGKVEISIADNGSGMNSEVMEHIFEPFFTTRPEGTGLGLSITYRIINDHNGRIDVESAPGKGADFRITLPATDQYPSNTTSDLPS